MRVDLGEIGEPERQEPYVVPAPPIKEPRREPSPRIPERQPERQPVPA